MVQVKKQQRFTSVDPSTLVWRYKFANKSEATSLTIIIIIIIINIITIIMLIIIIIVFIIIISIIIMIIIMIIINHSVYLLLSRVIQERIAGASARVTLEH